MATYYVSSVDGSNSDNGTTWALAVATLKYAVETLAATGGPHTILVDSAHSESLSADLVIVVPTVLSIISVNRSGGDAPLAGALIGAQATSYGINIGGGKTWFMSGVTLQINGSGAKDIVIGAGADNGHAELENCKLENRTTSANRYITLGQSGFNTYVKLKDCTLRFGAASCRVGLRTFTDFINCSIDSAGSQPGSTMVFETAAQVGASRFEGCDLSHIDGTLVGQNASSASDIYFTNCKLAESFTTTQNASQSSKGSVTVWMFNCTSGDEHYHFYHGDAFGETTAVRTYYADDGASYDGTNKVSWKIVTRASNCSFFTPYVSPWIEQYNADVSTAITPYLEGLRVDSTTVIQDDEVWAEFSVQDSTNTPQSVISSDRMALLGTPANQTSTKGFADWTGSPTDTDSGDSTFKLEAPSAVTPNEIGPLKARVIVGEPGLTVYIDPKIRV